MKKTLSGRNGYSKENGTQEDKGKTLRLANPKESEVMGILAETGLFSVIESYEAKEFLSGNTPAIKVKTGENEELVCAPDIRCFINEKDFFWVDVKDKPQRFFGPDTGCDIHQYISYYKINKYNKEPVLLFFKDPPLNALLSNIDNFNIGDKRKEQIKKDFSYRWNLFASDGKPYWYGNWLDFLSLYSDELGYPLCLTHRSRDMEMDICYMNVFLMQSYADRDSFTKLLKDYEKHRNVPDFKIKHQNFGIIEDISRMDERIREIFSH